MDCNFHLIKYEPSTSNANHVAWGLQHGETFKSAIRELVTIRKELMLAKNPSIKDHLDQLESHWT